MRSQLGWRTWVSLVFVSPFYNTRLWETDDIRKTMTKSRCLWPLLRFTTVYQVNRCFPRSIGPFAGDIVANTLVVDGIAKKSGTRVVKIDRKRPKTFVPDSNPLHSMKSIIWNWYENMRSILYYYTALPV